MSISMENIASSWAAHLSGQGDKRDRYIELLKEEFHKRNTKFTPDTEMIGAAFGKKREFITVSGFNGWRAYYAAEALGNDLVVTWNLYTPNKIESNRLVGLFRSDFVDINIAMVFASVTKDCALTAAELLLDEAGLDKTKINRQTSGVLGPI